MAVGQAVLTSALDVGALDAVETRLAVQGVAVCQAHAVLLREVLALHRVLSAAGAGLSTVPQAALLLQVSEHAAHQLLAEAQLLGALPGGVEAVECGLLTVAQSAALLRAVRDLAPEVQLAVWGQLQARLVAAEQQGVVLPPARLAQLLSRWAVQADPAAAQDRRRRAEAQGDVSYRRRDDGLGDLFATAVPAPLLQAVLCRIRAAARPLGRDDVRTAGKRRLDALLDLLLGRQPLTADGEEQPACAGARCGCGAATPVPCGVDVLVHVPLGAAMGTTDELAELVGHGPLDAEQLAAVLTNAPRVQLVRVDADGVPVSVDEAVHPLERSDLEAVRRRITALAAGPPGPAQPRHPFDHHDGRPAGPPGPAQLRHPFDHHDGRPPGGTLTDHEPSSVRPRLRAGGHPPGTSGPYRLPRRLRRLVQVRAPRCEWPGCGMRSQGCDVDHDTAHPHGPTCACGTGPLCRRHHRVKQLLMSKTRVEGSAVVWTDPTGRSWTSPGQHTPPTPPGRPRPAGQAPTATSDAQADDQRLPDADRPLDTDTSASAAQDQHDTDVLGDRIRDDDGWDLALDDPYRWSG